MPRPNRIIFNGAIYHIYQRGNNGEYIYQSPKHKYFLLKQFNEYNAKYDFMLLAYVIMDNHYHLIIKTGETPIDKIMFSINNIMSRFLNRELGRTGHVFEGRYNSKLVESDEYLVWLLRYIHRNPIRAQICSNLDEYRWSSHNFYKRGLNSFVKTEFILNIISNNRHQAVHQYLHLIGAQGDENDSQTDFNIIRESLNFSDSLSCNKQETKYVSKIKSLEEILSSLNIDDNSKILMKTGSKKRNLTLYKIKFIEVALSNKYTMREIGEFLGTSESSVSRLLSYYNISV